MHFNEGQAVVVARCPTRPKDVGLLGVIEHAERHPMPGDVYVWLPSQGTGNYFPMNDLRAAHNT